jgi:hypothetical protein
VVKQNAFLPSTFSLVALKVDLLVFWRLVVLTLVVLTLVVLTLVVLTLVVLTLVVSTLEQLKKPSLMTEEELYGDVVN